MKIIFISIISSILLIGYSCSKTVAMCEPKLPNCTDTIRPELCTAYFTRWFFDKNSNSCVQKSYSGCSAYGFATETECKECECK